MNKRIQILDCTLRDGGFGLEDANISSGSGLVFSEKDIAGVSLNLSRSNIDIVEIGSIEITRDNKEGMAIYQDLESISDKIPKPRNRNQIYAAFYRGPDTPAQDIPERNESHCDGVRVVLRYSELKKSLDFCGELSKKGYKVFMQPMVTMRYSNDELQMVIDAANDISAYALYFVDSYGYMTEEDVTRYFSLYDKGLNPSVRIGFHAHNNMNLAFSNALAFIKQESDRAIIIDSCCLGMGQGAGNLQTEIIADHMNRRCGASYDYDAVLAACEIVDKYWDARLWGYSLTRLLPAINRTAYKFSLALRNRYKLSFVEIHNILKNIPEEYRHRYTPDSAKELLKISGHADLIVEAAPK
jgi:4-hydroxy 2-oxovalerate aldolase